MRLLLSLAVCVICARAADDLKIVTLYGEGAVNSIAARTATSPVVEVRDEAERPVVGAEVIFELPAVGPGGSFADSSKRYATRTNSQGQASAPRIVPNAEQGVSRIRVTAALGNRSAMATVTQRNDRNPSPVARSGRRGSGRWKWLAILGGGAAAGGIFALTRGDGGAAAVPTSILRVIPGSVNIGGPR